MYLLLTRFNLRWYIPKWYFTSPDPWGQKSVAGVKKKGIFSDELLKRQATISAGRVQTSSAASSLESNWQKIWSSSLRMTLASTFSLPLERSCKKKRLHQTVKLRSRLYKGSVCVCVCWPVRHSHDYTLHSALAGHVDDCLEGWDEGFTAFQAESFLRGPLLLEKLLKPVKERWRRCFTLGLISIVLFVEEGVPRWSKPTQTLWIWSSGLRESASPPDWTSWSRVSQTSVWSTGTAARHWWT